MLFNSVDTSSLEMVINFIVVPCIFLKYTDHILLIIGLRVFIFKLPYSKICNNILRKQPNTALSLLLNSRSMK